MTEVIFQILKNNGLEESIQEAFNRGTNGKDSRLIIVRDAAITIAEKKIPEKKLVELLEKHLETKKHTAEKIVSDIKEKIIPYAKIIDLSGEKVKEAPKTQNQKENIEYDKEAFREELLKKINANRNIPAVDEPARNASHSDAGGEEPPISNVKKVDIQNVEKNAENMQREGKNIITEERKEPTFTKSLSEVGGEKPQIQESAPDKYKELIE